MELPLVNVSTCELRSVIRFFTAKNETAVNIHRNLVSVYGKECMSIQMVRRRRSWFLEGQQNVHDDERSGRPVTATDNAAVAAVRNVVKADRRVTIDEIMIRLPPGIEIGRSSIGTIMSDILNFRKVCARWVPRLLLENHKQQRMEAARAFLEMPQRDGDQLFSRIVTGDESWVHHSTPETKRQSMVWKKPEESAPKKAKVTISSGKVMAMENFKWEIFTHPPYSPELAPSDFHLFPALKWHLGGKHFANDDEVQAEENHWLRRQDTAWYNSGIKKLLQRYQKFLDRNDQDRKGYIETRREYLKLLERKRNKFNKDRQEKIKNATDPRTFWSAMATLRKRVSISRDIKIEDWYILNRELEEGQEIVSRNYHGPKWLPGVVYENTGPVSVKVETGDGKIINRHLDQVRSFGENESIHSTSSAPQVPPESEVEGTQDAPVVESPAVTPQPVSRRSSRIRKPTNIYDI
ncbi:hypothetical protein LAZ67_6003196 [Cordylochernes scorpioides]|uniref:Transposase n=1 Tax=Cordylochernes scorpioides TaxID=51811 RepID=A0ABY6KKC8_9ARAC|nr:hypothetical protein LAZ67_6003196 [Cordylochernes scorpioides]